MLHSIYESTFKEKEKNVLWEVSLTLDYLVKSNKENQEKINISRKENINYNNKNNNFKTKKEELCRNFMKGSCKFGTKCRFSHTIVKETPVIDDSEENISAKFSLEIRFPSNCKYPYQSPQIFLKPTASVPKMTCLQICRRLIEEADLLALDGIPSVYSIIDLIQNEESILEFLKTDNKKFPSSTQPLFPVTLNDEETIKKILPSHYERPANKDAKSNQSIEEMIKEDANIAKKFIEKQTNQQYKKMLDGRKKLPAWGKMNEILNAIETSQVIN